MEETKRHYHELLETSANRVKEVQADSESLRLELEEARSQLATVAADREDLAQFKKEAKEAAAEVHREGQAMEVLKTRWQQEVSDAKSELADAKAVILKQSDKIRELERGYSLKPNPEESRLRLEIGDLRSQLAEVAAIGSDVDPTELTNKLNAELKRGRPPKSKLSVKEVEKILSELKLE